MKKLYILLGFLCLKSIAVCATDSTTISVHYTERTPYLVTTDKGVEGLTGDIVTSAFTQAKIAFSWVETPPKRQIKILKENKNNDCIVGWFKNDERQKFAKYTRAIYKDTPQIALARSDNNQLQDGLSIDTLLSNSAVTLLIKDGYSYGTFLDAKVIEHKPVVYRATIENVSMLKMVHQKRIDYFFISPQEADGLIAFSEIPKNNFKYISFPDMSDGEKRYILCSQKVDDQVIKKLNAVIPPLTKREQ